MDAKQARKLMKDSKPIAAKREANWKASQRKEEARKKREKAKEKNAEFRKFWEKIQKAIEYACKNGEAETNVDFFHSDDTERAIRRLRSDGYLASESVRSQRNEKTDGDGYPTGDYYWTRENCIKIEWK